MEPTCHVPCCTVSRHQRVSAPELTLQHPGVMSHPLMWRSPLKQGAGTANKQEQAEDDDACEADIRNDGFDTPVKSMNPPRCVGK